MNAALMTLKVLLPFRVFAERDDVRRIVAETPHGSFGLLPHRLDCVAPVVPGIFTYETEGGGITYVAVDEGMLVKTGPLVLLSVRNAIGGADLGNLRAEVENHFRRLDEGEQRTRAVLAKMETGFLRRLAEVHHE